MKKALLVCGLSAVIASSLLFPSPSYAKTVKACAAEWTANKATIQTSGKTRKDFITECRAETASTEPAPATPTAQPAPAEQPTVTAPRARTAKTLKACAAEWTANKATIQAGGKTRKDFITECRAGTETTGASAAPSAGMTPSTAPAAGHKTAKACEAEWKAGKAAIQASGKKKTDFMTECRAETTSTAAAPTTAPQPAPAEQPKSEARAAPQPTTAERKSEAAAPPPPASTTPTAAGEFRTEAEAKAHCPGDTVVWANTRSKIYHYASNWRYGRTKSGAYMCEKDTATAGIRAAKREKRS